MSLVFRLLLLMALAVPALARPATPEDDPRPVSVQGGAVHAEGEALFRAGLSPLRAASTIATKTGRPTERARRLVTAIGAVLADAIAAGGSSLRDYRRADGALGEFQHAFAVYDREGLPCARASCRGIVRRIVQAGRSTFYCPKCQR